MSAEAKDKESGDTNRRAAYAVSVGLSALGLLVALVAVPTDYRRWAITSAGCALFLIGFLGLLAMRSPRIENIGFGINPRVRWFDVRVRSWIAFSLVFGTLVIIVVGIIRQIPASDLAGYVAPISGLAGLAVGYYFGTAGGEKDQ
jgi:hypothetical protein